MGKRVVRPPYFLFFFNDTATTEIYTLSLHDALPISCFLPSTSLHIRPLLPVLPIRLAGSRIGESILFFLRTDRAGSRRTIQSRRRRVTQRCSTERVERVDERGPPDHQPESHQFLSPRTPLCLSP